MSFLHIGASPDLAVPCLFSHLRGFSSHRGFFPHMGFLFAKGWFLFNVLRAAPWNMPAAAEQISSLVWPKNRRTNLLNKQPNQCKNVRVRQQTTNTHAHANKPAPRQPNATHTKTKSMHRPMSTNANIYKPK